MGWLGGVYVGSRQIVADRPLERERRRVGLQRMRRQSPARPIVVRIALLSQAPYSRQLLRHRNCHTVGCFLSGLDARLRLCRRVIRERAPAALDEDGVKVDETSNLFWNAVGRAG